MFCEFYPTPDDLLIRCTHLLMLDPSLSVLPLAPVFFERSEPARSTRLSFEFKLVSRVTPSANSSVVFFSTYAQEGKVKTHPIFVSSKENIN